MRQDEASTYNDLKRLRDAVDPLIASHAGRIVSTAGDGLLADFGSIVDAVSCAVEMQEASGQFNSDLAEERRLELRIGINLGDVIVAEDGDLYGDGVNIAARLQAIAEPGKICLSQTAYEQVKNKLDLHYHSLGRHRVKNIAEPIPVFSIEKGPRSIIFGSGFARRRSVFIFFATLVIGIGLLFALKVFPIDLFHNSQAVATLALPARMAERTPIAVLPFRNLSSDAGQDFLTDGIAEDIINALGRFSNLLVAAKSASFQFKDRNVSPADAGRILDVRYLVEGSIRRAGDRVRITVELTEAATGFHLWSDNYDIEMKDVFAIQEEITNRIVGAAAVQVTQFERDRVSRKPTTNLAAYEAVVRARSDLGNQTRAANADARSLFERAIELDPNYAEAYAALGWVHYEAAVSGWSEFYEQEMNEAEKLAKKALLLDRNNGNAHRLLANIHVYRRDSIRALAEVDRALAINPSDADNFLQRGYILLMSGKPAEAVTWLEGALRLDGTNHRAAMNLGVSKFFLGQYDEAVAAFDRALARDPGRIIQIESRVVLAATYARLKRQADVERERGIIERMAPFFDPARFAAQFGTPDAQREMLEALKAAGFRDF